jgi:mRNA interferase RelE/StbE
MASYNIRWKTSAVKELKKVNKHSIPDILQALENLSQDPYPTGSRKLRGAEFTYRLRVHQYMIIYTIHKTVLVIEIIRIRHRKDVYQKRG